MTKEKNQQIRKKLRDISIRITGLLGEFDKIMKRVPHKNDYASRSLKPRSVEHVYHTYREGGITCRGNDGRLYEISYGVMQELQE